MRVVLVLVVVVETGLVVVAYVVVRVDGGWTPVAVPVAVTVAVAVVVPV